MNKKLELIEAMMNLSSQLERMAKLLTIENICDPQLETTDYPIKNRIVYIDQYESWPHAKTNIYTPAYQAKLNSLNYSNLKDATILEFNSGPTHPVSPFISLNSDIVLSDYKFETQPPNVKIYNNFNEIFEQYDVGIAHESLEFTNPVHTLIEFKRKCKKIYIKFRPWTSRDGAFQSSFINRAYAHLVSDIDSSVLFKVVRPLATYESTLAKAGLAIFERKINNTPVDDFVNDIILDILIERTWGKLAPEEAIKILTTESVEYTVG